MVSNPKQSRDESIAAIGRNSTSTLYKRHAEYLSNSQKEVVQKC